MKCDTHELCLEPRLNTGLHRAVSCPFCQNKHDKLIRIKLIRKKPNCFHSLAIMLQM